MVRYLNALILALFLAPLGVQAEALPAQVQSVQCESLLSDFVLEDPAIVLEGALKTAIKSIENGQIEKSFKRYFRPPVLAGLRRKQYESELNELKMKSSST